MIAESVLSPAVRRERTLTASPLAVYRAWLDPDVVPRWLAPGSPECAHAEIDERVGGRYRIRQTSSDQPVGGFDGQLVELVPGRRIAWLWGVVGPGRETGPSHDSLLTVDLRGTADGGTRMTLAHERLDAPAAATPHAAEQAGGDWDTLLDRLAVAVER